MKSLSSTATQTTGILIASESRFHFISLIDKLLIGRPRMFTVQEHIENPFTMSNCTQNFINQFCQFVNSEGHSASLYNASNLMRMWSMAY